MACTTRARTLTVVAQQAQPVALPVVQRRAVLAALLAPIAAAVVAPAAQAASKKNLSRAELLKEQRAERKEAMKDRAAKVRSGDGKPSF
ncbi:hypothetical protein TSOC_011586 [Tetrabaena socialis]|uniref:Uncharacterized protein n=1 Tax=Tetrabaena socialis TaxID=47790 RepID=A0A2J7ZQA3_9CHLO|nr:hypothetical protein TSOC_011586 [Tetrabaena socialis]|eukprot:PNH02443.1 hypothetical protein TSOC_011586 [Tetrabaena socialis]